MTDAPLLAAKCHWTCALVSGPHRLDEPGQRGLRHISQQPLANRLRRQRHHVLAGGIAGGVLEKDVNGIGNYGGPQC